MSYSVWLSDAIQKYAIPIFLPVVQGDWCPDALLRFAIRRELAGELHKIASLSMEEKRDVERRFIEELKSLPIALAQEDANKQHYEVPAEFYQRILGPRLKYSCCYFKTSLSTLEDSEIAMLELYCDRAQLEDGMHVLDLGCGWGSLSLYLATKYPNSTITAMSNSSTQRDYIVSEVERQGLRNLTVLTADIATCDSLNTKFHRILSIEMMEHMKNYESLFEKLSRWLREDGKLFVHIFVTRHVPQHYEKGWMSETFFTGGTLPSDHLLLYFQRQLSIDQHWRVNGKHYQRTLEAWLAQLDQQKDQVLHILAQTYGRKDAVKWMVNWRLFLISCAEFFGINDGEDYFVSHYLFSRK